MAQLIKFGSQFFIINEGWNQISDSSILKFVKKQWPKLRKINLGDNYINNFGIKLLIRKIFTNIENFIVSNVYLIKDSNNFSWVGIQQIPLIPNKKLKILSLGGTALGNRGVKFLIKAELPTLENISLWGCALGAQGSKYFTKGNWPSLKIFSLNDNFLTQQFLFSPTNNWRLLQSIKYSDEVEKSVICLMNITIYISQRLKFYVDDKLFTEDSFKAFKKDVLSLWAGK